MISPALGRYEVKELHRVQRGLPVLESVVADLRLAFRSLRHRRGFTVTTVATLALGIGSCTVVFAVVNAVLLTSLPYQKPDRLVFAISTYGGQTSSISPPDFLDYRAENHSFSEFAAMGSHLASMTLTGSAEPQRVQVASVSGNFFAVFGTQPTFGRTFVYGDENGAASAVISHGLWQSRFGGRKDAIGEVLRLDGRPFTVTGVMPESFRFPNRPDIWVPFPLMNVRDRGAHQLLAVGRLRENVSFGAARQDMASIAARVEKAYPDTNKGFGIRISPLQQELVGFLENPLMILLAAVGLLLLLACANVANLLLARGMARARELATRIALGAGRARLVRLLMCEAAMLAFAGGLLGTFLASWAISLIAGLPVDLIPGVPPIPGLSDAAIDLRVLAFTVIVSVLVTVFVGLVPAVRGAGIAAMDSLRSAAGSAGRRYRKHASKSLVVIEVAISLTLLVGAGLVFRSFVNVMKTNPGFNASGMLTLQVTPQVSKASERTTYFVRLLDQVVQTPGVEAAAVVSELPLSGYGQEWYFEIQHRPSPSPTERPIASYRRISADYFRAMSIPVIRGRGFTPDEVQRQAPVAVVDERLTQMYFRGEDPLGKRVVLGDTPYEIVGIVGNVLHYALFQEVILGGAFPTLYAPDLTGGSSTTLVIRANTSSASVVPPLRETLQRADKNLPTSDTKPYDDVLSAGLLLPRLPALERCLLTCLCHQ